MEGASAPPHCSEIQSGRWKTNTTNLGYKRGWWIMCLSVNYILNKVRLLLKSILHLGVCGTCIRKHACSVLAQVDKCRLAWSLASYYERDSLTLSAAGWSPCYLRTPGIAQAYFKTVIPNGFQNMNSDMKLISNHATDTNTGQFDFFANRIQRKSSRTKIRPQNPELKLELNLFLPEQTWWTTIQTHIWLQACLQTCLQNMGSVGPSCSFSMWYKRQ